MGLVTIGPNLIRDVTVAAAVRLTYGSRDNGVSPTPIPWRPTRSTSFARSRKSGKFPLASEVMICMGIP